MSQSKHTPGPWEVKPHRPDETVCLIGPTTGGEFDYVAQTLHGNDEANARLIAASPDLAEALEEMISVLEQHAPVAVHRQGDRAYTAAAAARAALEKAGPA